MCQSFRKALIVAIVAAALPSTALAKSKARDKGSSTTNTTSGESTKPAETSPVQQAQDTEKPKVSAERPSGPPPEAPKPDAFGRIPFGPYSASSGKAVGIIDVKSSGADGKVQVWIDGRYFGMAPLTISAVPGGDYIVEGVHPDGKVISRPVSVVAGETAAVDLKSKISAEAIAGDGPTQTGGGEDAKVPGGRKTAYITMGAGALVLIAGGVVGYLTLRKQNEYNDAKFDTPADQPHVDDLGKSGKQLALISNIMYVVGGAAVLTGAVLWFATADEKTTTTASTRPRTMVMVAPTQGGAAAGFSMRF